jgi:hypothetical protein
MVAETPSDIYHRARDTKNFILEDANKILESGDPFFCTAYATNIIQGPWKEAEPIIKDNIYCSILYAQEALKGRFFDAEENILNNQVFYIYQYCKDIIKGPWKEAEPLIARNMHFSLLYATNILKSRFILGEESISQSPDFSYQYALKVIKGPWEKGEDSISQRLKLSFSYSTKILKAPFIKCQKLFEFNNNSNEEIKNKYREFLIKNGFNEWLI